MKHTHICPKCNDSNVFKIPRPASVGHAKNVVPKSFFTKANVDRYVCANCGYSEEWIAKAKDLEQLAKKYGGKEDGGGFV